MGYTHYVRAVEGTKGYTKALPVVKDILERYSSDIDFRADGKGINITPIRQAGESFCFPNCKFRFEFCKTNRWSYDIVVCEVLAVLRYFIPKLHVLSDGFPSESELLDVFDQKLDENWNKAIDNVSKRYNLDFMKLRTANATELSK